jgi:hypothetical protein
MIPPFLPPLYVCCLLLIPVHGVCFPSLPCQILLSDSHTTCLDYCLFVSYRPQDKTQFLPIVHLPRLLCNEYVYITVPAYVSLQCSESLGPRGMSVAQQNRPPAPAPANHAL